MTTPSTRSWPMTPRRPAGSLRLCHPRDRGAAPRRTERNRAPRRSRADVVPPPSPPPLLRRSPLLALVLCLSVLLRRASCFAGVGGGAGDGKIPVTVLSGFLGSGKTTLLRRLLQNGEGLKIAVIVNDVASVNIDSRLVAGTTTSLPSPSGGGGGSSGGPDAIVQLSNGCACCSLSDELLASVSELVTLSDLRDDPADKFDHIVVELSGVSEPRAVRGNFQDAAFYGMPLMDRVRLDTMVTVVDCGTYLRQLRSGVGATPEEAPELFYRTEEERLEAERERQEEEDWYGNLPEGLREALSTAGSSSSSPGLFSAGGAGVSDLLVEQTEIADVVLLNKVDIPGEDGRSPDEIDDIERVVSSLNPRARVLRTEFGAVESPGDVLGAAGGRGVVEAGVVDDHRDFVEAAERDTTSAAATRCDDPDCVDPTHDHSHSHDHGSEEDAAGAAKEEKACADPDCADPSHSHLHSHSHAHGGGGRRSSFGGVGTYVYRARRPFHPRRLAAFLRGLPVTRGLPPPPEEEEEGPDDDRCAAADAAAGKEFDLPERAREALSNVLRSKGFAWTADSNVAALYWSHAGSSFEMQCLGRWWATLPREQWPPEATNSILAEFDDEEHDDASDPTFSSGTVGDRRQEIVFIGPGVGADGGGSGGGGAAVADVIRDALDKCLLTDEEWDRYRERAAEEGELRDMFANPIRSRVVSY